MPANTINPGTPLARGYLFEAPASLDGTDMGEALDNEGIYHWEYDEDLIAVVIDSKEDDLALARLSARLKLFGRTKTTMLPMVVR